MKKEYQFELLCQKYFIIGLILLIANDFIFKFHFHNQLTGKISDYAGLFIFPYFCSVFFKKYTKWIYIFTGIGFMFWKSPYSEPFIEMWNDNMYFKTRRIVDYTDLLALIILPISYKYLKIKQPIQGWSTVYISFISMLSLFSFSATTCSTSKSAQFEAMPTRDEIMSQISKKEKLARAKVNEINLKKKYIGIEFYDKGKKYEFSEDLTDRCDIKLNNNCIVAYDSLWPDLALVKYWNCEKISAKDDSILKRYYHISKFLKPNH